MSLFDTLLSLLVLGVFSLGMARLTGSLLGAQNAVQASYERVWSWRAR